jgi:hypothetical protein
MKFEWNASRFQLPFLDVHILLERWYCGPFFVPIPTICMRVYQKALNACLYIPWRSFHPTATKCAVVKGELIRVVPR